MPLLPLILALAACQGEATIVWKPKLGNEYKFLQKAAMHMYGGKSDLKDVAISLIARETIKTVAADGTITLEELKSPVKVVLNGKDVTKQVASTDPAPVSLVKKPDGEDATQAPDPMQFGLRAESMTTFIYPGRAVKRGESWTFTNQGEPSKGTSSSEAVFTFEGQETVNGILSNRVKLEAKEVGVPSPATAGGTFWLATDDGELVKKSLKVRGAGMKLAEAGKMNIDITMDRTM